MKKLGESIFNAFLSFNKKINNNKYLIEDAAKEKICSVFEDIVKKDPINIKLCEYCLIISKDEVKEIKKTRFKKELNNDYLNSEFIPGMEERGIFVLNQFLIDIKKLNLKQRVIDACDYYYHLIPTSNNNFTSYINEIGVNLIKTFFENETFCIDYDIRFTEQEKDNEVNKLINKQVKYPEYKEKGQYIVFKDMIE